LWRRSCFEAFIGHGGGPDYWEYNFSPSGAWAAYHFSAYREGMAPLLKGAAPTVKPRIRPSPLKFREARSFMARAVCLRPGTASRSGGGRRRQSASAGILGPQTSRGETRFPSLRQLCG
jgi:hypothetical protein